MVFGCNDQWITRDMESNYKTRLSHNLVFLSMNTWCKDAGKNVHAGCSGWVK